MDQQKDSGQKNNFIWILLAITNLVLVVLFLSNYQKNVDTSSQALNLPSTTASVSVTPVDKLIVDELRKPTTSTLSNEELPLFILSIHINQKSKIYLYHPNHIPFTQLFDDPYEQIHPSISPDQNKLAFSAKKNGYWDIYFIDLNSGLEERVTDTPEYDGAPTWSSDGNYIAYESYKNGNLDIFIQDVNNLTEQPIQLTEDTYAQFSPVWSPNGREIAFVSTQNGDEEIWLAKLDDIDNRFNKLIDRPDQIDINPSWSENGEKILWSSEKNGYPVLMMADISNINELYSEIGIGNFASLTNTNLSYIQKEANQDFLISKNILDNNLIFPAVKLPGNTNGFSQIPSFQKKEFLNKILEENPIYTDNLITNQNSEGRKQLVMIESRDSVENYLHEDVLEPFNIFRSTLATETGWDFLYQLEKAFVPITEPVTPGMAEEWLFTGRGFEFNPLSTQAGLITTVKEERNGQVFWRIFIKTRYQDGSQGMPLKQMPFDISARYNSVPSVYEAGGKRNSIPEGYWIDITELANSLNWERLPALGSWQYYFESTRFNQFVFTSGLDWYAAMKELYPVEAFKTPSPIPTNPLTPTVSPTIRYFRSPTITFTPTETMIPTRRPTWTPIP